MYIPTTSGGLMLCDSCGKSVAQLTYIESGLICCPYKKVCNECLILNNMRSGLERDENKMSDGIRDAFKSTVGGSYTIHDYEKKDIKLVKGSKMTKAEYFEFHQQCIEKMSAITKAKNADYTGTGDDPFANFTRVEALGVCSTEQGFLTRMVDKLARINSFAQKGELQVKDESVEDTLLDLANYAILFAGYIKSKN